MQIASGRRRGSRGEALTSPTVFEEEYVVFSKTANEYEKACALKRREEADAEEEEVEVKPEPSASTQTSSLASGDVYDAEMKWSDDEDEDEDACREVDAEQATASSPSWPPAPSASSAR